MTIYETVSETLAEIEKLRAFVLDRIGDESNKSVLTEINDIVRVNCETIKETVNMKYPKTA